MRFTFHVLFFFLLLIGQAQVRDLPKAATFYSERQFSEALVIAEKATLEQPERVETWWLVVACYLELGDLKAAQVQLDKAMARHPNHSDLNALQADVHLQNGAFEKALAIYQNLPGSSGPTTSATHLSSVDIATRKSHCYTQMYLREERSGNASLANTYIAKAAATTPKDIQIQRTLVYSCLQLERYEKAVAAASMAMQLFPNDIDLLRMKASAHFHLNQLDEVTKSYEALYATDLDDLSTGLALVELKLSQGEANAAEAILLHLSKAHPKTPEVYVALVTLESMRSRPVKQLAWCDTALLKVSDKRPFLEMKVAIFSNVNQQDSARWMLQKLIELDPKDKSYPIQMAYSFAEDNQLAKGVAYLEDVLNDYPRVDVYLAYADLTQEMGAWERSYEKLRAFVDSKEQPKLAESVGIAAFQTQRFQVAATYFEAAIEQGNLKAEGHYYYSLYLLQTGNDSTAANFMGAALLLAIQERSQIQENVEDNLQREGYGAIHSVAQKKRAIQKATHLIEVIFQDFEQRFPSIVVREKLEQLLVAFPNTLGVLFLGARHYYAKGDYREAQQLIEKSLRLNPDQVESHLLAAQIYEAQNQLPKALQSAARARGLQPSDPKPYKELIRLHETQGTLDTLAQEWSIRLSAERKNEALREALIQVLHKLQRYEDAQDIIQGKF